MRYRIFFNCYYEDNEYLKGKYKELQKNKYLIVDDITGERIESDDIKSFDYYLNARIEHYSKQQNIELIKLYSDESIVYKIKKFKIIK